MFNSIQKEVQMQRMLGEETEADMEDKMKMMKKGKSRPEEN